jgi:hypothetical protein
MNCFIIHAADWVPAFQFLVTAVCPLLPAVEVFPDLWSFGLSGSSRLLVSAFRTFRIFFGRSGHCKKGATPSSLPIKQEIAN